MQAATGGRWRDKSAERYAVPEERNKEILPTRATDVMPKFRSLDRILQFARSSHAAAVDAIHGSGSPIVRCMSVKWSDLRAESRFFGDPIGRS